MLIKLCCYLGIISLAHAAFSAAQHRSYQRLVMQEGSDLAAATLPWQTRLVTIDLPADIVLQALLSFFLVLVSIIASAGAFQEIRTLDELNRVPRSQYENSPSVFHFNHRGRVLK